jgi:hypothetical protein
MSESVFQLAEQLVAEARRVLPEEDYRRVLKNVRGLVRQVPRLPGLELGPYPEEETNG